MDRYVKQVRTRSVPDTSREEDIYWESEIGLASGCLAFLVCTSCLKLECRGLSHVLLVRTGIVIIEKSVESDKLQVVEVFIRFMLCITTSCYCCLLRTGPVCVNLNR